MMVKLSRTNGLNDSIFNYSHNHDIISKLNNSNYEDHYNVDTSFGDFCKYHINETIEPRIEPILCPKVKYHKDAYCSQYVDNNRSISNYHNQTIYKNFKSYYSKLFKDLLKYLKNRKVYFIGDSVTIHSYAQIECLSHYTKIDIHNNFISRKNMGFPTSIHKTWSNYDFVGIRDKSLNDIRSEQWYDDIRGNDQIQYVIINTGNIVFDSIPYCYLNIIIKIYS